MRLPETIVFDSLVDVDDQVHDTPRNDPRKPPAEPNRAGTSRGLVRLHGRRAPGQSISTMRVTISVSAPRAEAPRAIARVRRRLRNLLR